LRGAGCPCFPWIQPAVGPGYFIGDSVMIVLAVAAGFGSIRSRGVRPAVIVLGAVAVFASLSFGFATTRHTATPRLQPMPPPPPNRVDFIH
jgi:hypothetical protein